MSSAIAPHARSRNFDVLRCLCAFLIVYIHCPFPSVNGAFCIAIARVAVFLFFMMTGYFYNADAAKTRHLASLKKTFILLLCALALYLVWQLLIYAMLQRSAMEFIADFFSAKQLLSWALFGDISIGEHLWYLDAMLRTLILIFFADYFHLRKLLYYIALPLLSIGYLLGQYSFLFGRDFDIPLYRNALLLGLPCFCIGAHLRKKANAKKGTFSPERLHLTTILSALCSIVFAITSLLEARFLLFVFATNGDYYLSTLLLAASMFIFTICIGAKDDKTQRNKTQHTPFVILSIIGARYAATIYIVHPLILTAADIVMARIGAFSPTLLTLYQTFATSIIFLAALCFAFLLQSISDRILRK